jgi:RNA polymerase sigma-70 factor (ECF subfamily)
VHDSNRSGDEGCSPGADTSARDQQLIARLSQGDETALSELVRTYGQALFGVAVAMVGSADLAQDIVQDVFCWLWDTRMVLRINGRVAAYLVRATRNRTYNVLRHERSQRHIAMRTKTSQGDAGYTYNAGESSLLERELQRAIEVALETLQPRTREIFLLHIDQGLRYEEIARVLQITVPTVRLQMSRANRQLWRLLREWF